MAVVAVAYAVSGLHGSFIVDTTTGRFNFVAGNPSYNFGSAACGVEYAQGLMYCIDYLNRGGCGGGGCLHAHTRLA